MHRAIKLLNPKTDPALTLAPTGDYRFAAAEMTMPIVFSEMADIAREYPLVFLKGQSLPVALLGIEQGVNAYVSEDGRWLANYIPGRVRAYPFTLVANPNVADSFAVGFDAEAPEIAAKDGFALFDNTGQPSPTLKARMDLLQSLKQQEPRTTAMVEALRGHGILIDRAIRIARREGEDSQLTGLEVVDEQAFNALPDAEFANLRSEGLLPLIYAHLLSMANLRHGTISGKYPQLREPQSAAPVPDMSSFFGDDDDDTLDFKLN